MQVILVPTGLISMSVSFRSLCRNNWKVKLTYGWRIEEWIRFYNYYFGHNKDNETNNNL